jgi:hypothetical protein
MHGVSLRSELIRTAYFEGTAKALNTFRGFLEEAIRAFAHPSGHLAPNSLDAIYQNALIHDSGGYKWFDLEWTNKEPVTSSWFILRNLLVLRGDQEFWLHDKSPYNLKKIYTGLCRDLRVQPNLSTDIRKEAELRGRVSVEKNAERHEKAIRRTLRQPFIGITYPRHTVKEFYLRQIYGIVRRPSASLFLRIPLIAWYALRNRGRQAI